MDSTPAGGPTPKSLLLGLPREVRLKIYNHAVEPWTVLTHTRRDYIMEKRACRRENYGTVGVYLPSRDCETRPRWHPESTWPDPQEDTSESGWDLHDNNDESWDAETSRFGKGPQILPTLGYQVSTYSPLLLVNKQVSSEVVGWIKDSELHQSLHSIIRQCIFGDTLVPSREPTFLQIIGHSKLVLSLTADFSISFLQRLPDHFRRYLRSVALMGATVQWSDGPTRLAWSKKKTERHAAYALSLRRCLPNLREVAISIPRKGLERDMFCTYAPAELADMLYEGVVDTLRFLYKEPYGPEIFGTDTTLEAVQATECLACGKRQSWMESGLLKRCGRCLKAWYCSSTCQKTNWKSHRAWCQEANESEKSKPPRDPRLPRFDVTLEQHAVEESDQLLEQTAAFPQDRWMNYETVIALRRDSGS